MNRRRIVFFSIFATYQLIAFIFTVVMESNTSFLFKLVGYVGWFKYATFFGFTMVIVEVIWWWLENRNNKRKEEASRLENNTLKAQVYDLQLQVKKETPTVK